MTASLLFPNSPVGQDTRRTTEERLHESAVELFARYGYSATTTRQIAAAAGVTVGSMYNHVASKQALLFEVMRRTHEIALARLDASLTSVVDPAAALQAAVHAHALFHAEHGVLVAVTNHEMGALQGRHRKMIMSLRDQYGQRFKDIVRQGIEEGVFHVDRPDFAVLAILTMGVQVAFWFKKRDSSSGWDVAEAYSRFALLLVGCSVDQPRLVQTMIRKKEPLTTLRQSKGQRR